MESSDPTALQQIWNGLTNLSTPITWVFFGYWVWKHQDDIAKQKQRIEQFTALGMLGSGGIFAIWLFGHGFVGLTYNAIIGNISGLEQVPEIFHIPIIAGVIGLCGLIVVGCAMVVCKVGIEIKKSILNPAYKI